MIRLTFQGGARTVTGSRYLLEADGEAVLLDCGMFQGLKRLRELNWRAPSTPPSSLASLVLTHAHIDHSGALPRLVKQGFDAPVHATPATCELARFMLADAAHIQVEDARFLNRKGRSRHSPALPLYDLDDAEAAVRLFQPVEYGVWRQASRHIAFRFLNAGHLLGSAMVQVRAASSSGEVTILFSGDVGRYGMPVAPDPEPPPDSDYLVVESTYGDRCHCGEDVEAQLEQAAGAVLRRGGLLIVPSFAVGRAQQMIFLLRKLTRQGRLPRVPIWLDSPMALEATQVYGKYHARQQGEAEEMKQVGGELVGDTVRLVRTQRESMALNETRGPGVIISSSGMLTGGRILHHLAHHLPDKRNFLLLVGYQAEGTRGRALQEGTRMVRVHKEEVPVRAGVGILHGLSGHADQHELARWLRGFAAPRTAFVTHGEEQQALGLAAKLRADRGFRVEVPALGEGFDL